MALAWSLAVAAGLVTLVALVDGRWLPFDMAAALMPLAPILAIAVLLLRPRSAAALGALVAGLAAVALIIGEVAGGPAWVEGERRMVVLTHNVNEANDDPERTLAVLRTSGADILLLQETNGRFGPYLGRLRREYPYANECRENCSLAILSRWPLARVRWRFRDDRGMPIGPGLIQAVVRLPWGGEAGITSIHLSRMISARERAARRVSLARVVALMGAKSRTLVIGGDFNLVPWGAAMRDLDAAMTPMQRVTRGVFSFPRGGGEWLVPFPVVPIDHLYIGPAWRVADVKRLQKTGSDHYPIRTTLVSPAIGL